VVQEAIFSRRGLRCGGLAISLGCAAFNLHSFDVLVQAPSPGIERRRSLTLGNSGIVTANADVARRFIHSLAYRFSLLLMSGGYFPKAESPRKGRLLLGLRPR
jgi:hypothetical protein